MMTRSIKKEIGRLVAVLLALFLLSCTLLTASKIPETYGDIEFPMHRISIDLNNYYLQKSYLFEKNADQYQITEEEFLNNIVQEYRKKGTYLHLTILKADKKTAKLRTGHTMVVRDKEKIYTVKLDEALGYEKAQEFSRRLSTWEYKDEAITGYAQGNVLHPASIEYTVKKTGKRETLHMKPSYTNGAVLTLGYITDYYFDIKTIENQGIVEQKLQKKGFLQAERLEREARYKYPSALSFEHSLATVHREPNSFFKKSGVLLMSASMLHSEPLYRSLSYVTYPFYAALSALLPIFFIIFLVLFCVFIILLSNKFINIYKEQQCQEKNAVNSAKVWPMI